MSDNDLYTLRLNSFDTNRVAILLQLSPVDPQTQRSRLETIDRGWAAWRNKVSHCGDIDIFAPDTKKDRSVFANIMSFTTNGTNPFQRLLDSFVHIVTSNHYDWMVFGNDHSFIVPPNLLKFLRNLNEDELIYTGNKLGITYQNKFIRFSSGGAGAVLSRPAVLAVLATWSILHPTSIRRAIQRGDGCNVLQSLPACNDSVVDIRPQSSVPVADSLGCIAYLSQQQKISGIHMKVQLRLSEMVTAYIDGFGQSNFLVVSTQSVAGDNDWRRIVHKKTIDSFCTSGSTWALENPGIILASCLQEVWNINFTDALAGSVEGYKPEVEKELFNVYGPVRLLTGSIDEWYKNMKKRVREKETGVISSRVWRPYLIPESVISFHYISEAESILLYHILTNFRKISTPVELMDLWPSRSQVGPYSRHLKSIEESNTLFNVLTCIAANCWC